MIYNATAVRGALWWLRQSHSINYANHQHSPGGGTTFARRRHDIRQAAARRCKLHFPRYRLVKVSWKSVQPFPRTVVWYFVTGKNKKQKTQKTSVKHIRICLIGGCVKYAPSMHLHKFWTTDFLQLHLDFLVALLLQKVNLLSVMVMMLTQSLAMHVLCFLFLWLLITVSDCDRWRIDIFNVRSGQLIIVRRLGEQLHQWISVWWQQPRELWNSNCLQFWFVGAC